MEWLRVNPNEYVLIRDGNRIGFVVWDQDDKAWFAHLAVTNDLYSKYSLKARTLDEAKQETLDLIKQNASNTED